MPMHKYAFAVQAKCPECGRVFDLTVEEDANEWFNGHDCGEDPEMTDGFA